MRLIDADKLLRDNPVHVTGRILLPSGKSQNIDAIQVSAINSAPTVDAVTVVRGEWIPKTGRAMCSVCADECWADSALEYAYCPNCGAKMEDKP